MPAETVQIKRYPNRRFYALGSSRYVCLPDIEALIHEGKTVEIRDSQTGEDITRIVLTQMIVERHPDKISLFPPSMLHFMLRANDVVSDFLRDYFRNSLTYLEYLQQHGAMIEDIPQPMHWMKAWFQPPTQPTAESQDAATSEETATSEEEGRAETLARRVEQLERRLHELESRSPRNPDRRESK